MAYLVGRYASRLLDEESVKLCCYSFCDNNSYLNSDRRCASIRAFC